MAKNVVKSVQLKWNKTAERQISRARIDATFNLGYDIAAKARENAPVVSGALRNSIRVETIAGDKGIQVIAGGASSKIANGIVRFVSKTAKRERASSKTAKRIVRFVNYAAKRERGPNRDPATEHYMENAMKETLKGDWIKKYYGHITQKGAK